MNSELIAATAGLIMSVIFEYVPGVESWFANKSPQYKRLTMLVLMILTGAGAFGLSCYSPYELKIECSNSGAWGVVGSVVTAVVANQGFHRLTKKQ